MDTALAQKSMTAEEFAVWAEARPEKHWELFQGVAEMQQSQTWGHQQVIGALYRLFYASIREKHLDLYVGSQGLVVEADPKTAFEPDVVVFSGRMEKAGIIAANPMIVVEVLSPSTARRDFSVKLAGYFKVPSIEHYIIADWEACELIHYRREGAAIAPPVILREGELRLDPPGIGLALADVFVD
jgi:Uma2 family endonuclease